MKKIAIFILAASLLITACVRQATPTATDAELATKLALVLTNMPTATGSGPKLTTNTPGLPTVAGTGTKAAVPSTQPATPLAGTTLPSATGPAATAAPTKAATTAPTAAATAAGATATTSAVTGTPATATATKSAATATPAGPTATPVPGDPKTALGEPTWKDAMNTGDNWPTAADPAGFTEIGFQNGYMELTALKPIDGWRLTFDKLTNAYLEMTVNTGSCLPLDRYGIIARVPSLTDANRGYLFGFTCGGKFSLRKWDGSTNSMTNFIVWKTNAAINAGANKVNRLGVMMKGNKLSMYANGVLLGEVMDNTWLEGNFGVFAGAHESPKYTLKVDEMDYWKLP